MMMMTTLTVEVVILRQLDAQCCYLEVNSTV